MQFKSPESDSAQWDTKLAVGTSDQCTMGKCVGSLQDAAEMKHSNIIYLNESAFGENSNQYHNHNKESLVSRVSVKCCSQLSI